MEQKSVGARVSIGCDVACTRRGPLRFARLAGAGEWEIDDDHRTVGQIRAVAVVHLPATLGVLYEGSEKPNLSALNLD